MCKPPALRGIPTDRSFRRVRNKTERKNEGKGKGVLGDWRYKPTHY
jgi:hypothetical protein